MRTIVLLPLLAGLASGIQATGVPRTPPTTTQDAIASVPCPNPLPHELVLVYEVSGGTLLGPVDGILTVYSDGSARYGSSLGPGPGFEYLTSVGPQGASDLVASLLAAGAPRQCDDDQVWNDVPLSTLTVLRGDARQRAASFSWYVAQGEVATIEGLLQAFVAGSFPPPPTGGSGSF